ncbi:hypothetical protein Sjap_010428 [Stephania japonica]|uniref:Uncharacterized protein n=1 Tax=Stephania japonica TaxID=461633 RepID=A0AAP0P746_9MAGN
MPLTWGLKFQALATEKITLGDPVKVCLDYSGWLILGLDKGVLEKRKSLMYQAIS